MPSCTILQAGIMTTIQDKGRHGLAHYAIPPSGYMDRQAAEMASLLVGNAEGGAVLECALSGPTIRFENEALIALTGSHMRWKIDGVDAVMNQSIIVKKDSVLKGSYSREGLYGYIAIAGHLETTYDHDSCSSYQLAGMGHKEGKPLTKGDELKWKKSLIQPPLISMSARKVSDIISIIKGPEYHLLTEASQLGLSKATFSKTPQSNRIGARLEGQILNSTETLIDSVPVIPGTIQLPPSGNPIVVLKDGQTTGGYPRIGFIADNDMDDFCQAAFGKSIRLVMKDQ